MTYEELCKHFDKHRPRCLPVGRQYWFSGNFQNEYECINDILIRWLNEWNIPWLRVNLGEIWFLYEGQWTRTEWEPNSAAGTVMFYLLEYAM